MVSRSPADDFTPNPPPSPQHQPDPAPAGTYEVIVPVFLKVRLTAPDDLAAECMAIDHARKMGTCTIPHASGTVHISIQSIIRPVVK
jgi:hypothetical protein